MKIQPPDVQDRESAAGFVVWCVSVLGLGYHPDTPFTDYVDSGGQPIFSPAEAARFEELAGRACGLCDPYEIGELEFQRILGQLPRKA